MTGLARLSVRGLRSELAGPFDLELQTGRCAVITGPSGAGKSLFLRMLADLDPNQGEVRLNDRERGQFAPADWRRRVTYVPAEAGWWEERVMTHFAADRRDVARGLARQMGLGPELFEVEVSRLSTGEKQRFALVRALVLDAPVLLLDEPTGALDQASVALVEGVLRARLSEGGAIIMVTHDESFGQRMGDQRYRMSQRRLSAA
jgi:putative ABC transport system ATP-binding protein